MQPARERLKEIPSLVSAVRKVRGARRSVLRSLADAAHVGRHRRIERYLGGHTVRKLHLGAGEHIHHGWLNTDLHDFKREHELVYLDARKPFPLPDASFDIVFSEHLIEHLTYAEGQRCLLECFRVLRSGGRIRIATPSLDRLVHLFDEEPTDLQRRYVRWAIDTLVADADAYLPGLVVNNFFQSWGHRFIYDEQTLRHSLATAGFVEIEQQPVGQSAEPQLAGLERHLSDTPEFNEYETLVLEARRP